MRSTLAAVIAVGVLCGTSALAAAPVGAGKVYSGAEGVAVTVVPLTTEGPKGEKQALLLVQGTDSEFDGKAMLHSINETNRGADYITQYKGEDFYTLVMRGSSSAKSYELWVPRHRDALKVAYDEKRSEAVKAEDIYDKYQKLQKDGTLAKMAAFNRPEREAANERGFAELLKGMNDACGTKMTAAIDWKSVSDEVIKRYSVSSYCGNPLEALRRLCETPVGRRIISAKVKKVSCQFGKELKLDIQDGAVSFTTEQEAANQEELASEFFKKNL
jgi:hypothetical protein